MIKKATNQDIQEAIRAISNAAAEAVKYGIINIWNHEENHF